MKITIHDPTFCQTDQPKSLRINELSFKKEFYKKEAHYGKMKRHEYYEFLINSKGFFLTGLLPRILQYCKDNKIDFEIISGPGNLSSEVPLEPDEISSLFKLRDDQKILVTSALNTNRGVITAPMGTGKTVLIAAIISAFSRAKVLFLCHTLTLLKQTQKEFDNYNLKDSSIISGANKNTNNSKIIVSTVQSFSKPELLNNLYNKFDIVFIDECHHVSTAHGLYAQTLTRLTAPRRYGFTATIPTGAEAKFSLEGLVGPIIGNFSINEAIDQEILAIPKIELLPIPTCPGIKDLYRYNDIYTTAIVEYRKRNRIIIEKAITLNSEGKSVLVYITKIEHGERLMEIADLLKTPFVFVRGELDSETREKIRLALDDKKILNAVATTVWSEGVNIPSLDCILFAGGGKSELALLQKLGRALRKTKQKTEATIIFPLDSGKYLSEHCISGLKTFIEKGWI